MPGEGQLPNPKASGPQWVQGLRENFPEEVILEWARQQARSFQAEGPG